MKLKFITSNEIRNVIISFKLKGSHGYDGIPIKILKLYIPYSLSPLTFLCNLMISAGIFPTKLKFAEINPYIRKGKSQTFLTIDLFAF